LRRAGWRVVRLERPMVSHYTAPADRIASIFGRRRRRLYLGAGQVLRRHARTPLARQYLRERGFALPAAAGLGATGLAVAVSLGRRDIRPLSLWLVVVALVLAGDAARKRSLYRTVHSLMVRLLFLEGTVRGYRHGTDGRELPRYDVLRATTDDMLVPSNLDSLKGEVA
ncbi:MAG TPA: hypothetical protein VFU72_07880, partial [Nitrolancea sp.]|nr:hypothetical protein [Nitrolancea sp.]